MNLDLFNLNQTYCGKTNIKQSKKGSKLPNRRKISQIFISLYHMLEMKQKDPTGLNKKGVAIPVGFILQHSTFSWWYKLRGFLDNINSN